MSKKNHLPEITLTITRQQLIAFVRLMQQVLTDEATLVTYTNDLQLQLLWAMNLGIYRQWVKKTDLQSDKTNIRIDVAQGLAFMQYWQPDEYKSTPYEQQIMRTIISALDRELKGLKFHSFKSI